MRLNRYLTEASRPGKVIFTINDIKKLNTGGWITREAERNIDTLLDDEKYATTVLKRISKESTKALKMLGNVPYYSKKNLLMSFMDMDELLFKEKDSELWPIVFYISSGPNDRDTVGIMVFQNGKKKMFEGNDEASAETYEIVDEVLGNVKPVVVYAQHGEKTVEKIYKTNTLPKNLYVSPSKKYAEGYWSTEETRTLFACVAMSNAFRKESDVDWKTKEKTKIKNFTYV